ncbi:MAG: hypothetical protein GX176_07780 [Syntrophomonadaceae bacterium]|nr:hypothetical protein [Syntrophomonadaceae bacterium]HQD91008.1 hypothetical protein [Syntrophomonadaceae bacterium]
MKNLAPNEILALSALITMETQGLAFAKASIPAMEDEQLRTMTETAIMSAEARIQGMQQLIHDKNINSGGVN